MVCSSYATKIFTLWLQIMDACSDDETVQEAILFVLSKLVVLEDGTEELRKFCPLLIHIAVDALSKTESDGLKTNSIGNPLTLNPN